MSFNGEQIYLYGLSAVTTSRGGSDPELGSVRTEGTRQYRYVYNAASASDAYPGYAMCVLAPSSTGYSATISTTVNTPLLGIVRHATIAAGSFGWVMFRGQGSITASATVAAQDNMVIGENGLFATALTLFKGFVIPNSAIVTGASGGAAIKLI